MNPDGYEYTFNENRNWRKTRVPVSLVCYGVDANRNWAFNWLVPDEIGDEGASRAPCSDTYAGYAPFSELEASSVNNYLTKLPGVFDAYITFHSYAHLILHPYGHLKARAVSVLKTYLRTDFNFNIFRKNMKSFKKLV